MNDFSKLIILDQNNKELILIDSQGNQLVPGDKVISILNNIDELELNFGLHKAYCHLDGSFLDTVGFYFKLVNNERKIEPNSFPIGNTSEWCLKI